MAAFTEALDSSASRSGIKWDEHRGLGSTPATNSLSALAAATPASRDRYVDFLRGLAIAMVAVGHWLVVVPTYRDGSFDGVNALDTVPLMRGRWSPKAAKADEEAHEAMVQEELTKLSQASV